MSLHHHGWVLFCPRGVATFCMEDLHRQQKVHGGRILVVELPLDAHTLLWVKDESTGQMERAVGVLFHEVEDALGGVHRRPIQLITAVRSSGAADEDGQAGRKG